MADSVGLERRVDSLETDLLVIKTRQQTYGKIQWWFAGVTVGPLLGLGIWMIQSHSVTQARLDVLQVQQQSLQQQLESQGDSLSQVKQILLEKQ